MDRSLFDLNPNPVLIYDKDSLKILEANGAFWERYGFPKDELKSLTLYDLRPKDVYGELDAAIENRKDNESNHTQVARHHTRDGDVMYVMVSSHPYKNGYKNARMAFIHDVTERVEAEEKAKQAFNELNHHVNHSPLAMIKWDADFKIIEWSERAKEITGYPKSLVLGHSPEVFDFYEDDMEVVESNMEYLMSGKGDKTHFEVKMYHHDGHLVDLSIHTSVMRNESGDLISVLTFIEDVTNEKQAEIRYQRLFENANDGIFIMDGDKFIECNSQVVNIFGLDTKEQILGKSPVDFSPELQPDGQKSVTKARRKIKKALEGTPQVFEWQHQTLDGKPVDVEVSLNRLQLVEDVCVQAIVRDLTEQKKAQEKLRKSEELFRKLFLKAPGAMVMIDTKNRVQKVNKSFEELFGYTEEELLNKDIDEIIVGEEDDQVVPRMPDKGFEKDKFYTDIIRYSKQGEKLNLLLGAIPVYLDDNPIAGFGIYVDITEQKKYQEQLQQSVKEKQVLLEEIHHRVKNNLAIISGMLQLQSFEAENEEIRNALNDGQLRIQSIGIVHELLYQSENFIDISFEEYISKLIDTIKNTLPFNHQHINVEVDTGDVLLDINQAIPSAILINELVTNAYKHAFDDNQPGTIEILLTKSDKEISIIVRDDGKGLPEGFTVGDHASIGMNLIETLTNQLEGELYYTSDGGTEFKVVFENKKQTGSGSLLLAEKNKKS
ncbi:MAG: PAS domain S-box protein [Aliifodinibius sp.]|nr:PAS domain S-box protein [Fodinibius sp.]NIV10680.1 PAS domain S-box protein [Fodinibius sp.]NIY24290.1 PAS domain S-box protein [Fodinibius sp.]